MTMFRQIALLVALGFALVFALVSYDNFKQSTELLRGQLETTVRDTATVLGISLTTTGAASDSAALETLFNAVFDSGYYSDIRLVATDGSVLYEKQRSHSVIGVPEWFVEAIHLPSTTGRAQVMKGWVQVGTLQITLHPGYAYSGLYSRLTTTLVWFSIIFASGLLLLWWVLHVLLKPLGAVYQQAQDIQNNQFVQLSKVPRTRELKRVVEAMNRLSKTVERVYLDQQETWGQYQNLLYRDDLTGLRNRRSFLGALEYLLSEKADFQGQFVLIRVEGIEQMRGDEGYEAADEALCHLGTILSSLQEDALCARISDDEFVALVPGGRSAAEMMLRSIFERYSLRYAATPSFLVGAASQVYGGKIVSEVFSELDLTISHAAELGPYQYSFPEGEGLSLPQGRQEWRTFIQAALAEAAFYLVVQPVQDMNGSLLHREVFVRLDDEEGRSIPASIFMPMANQLDLATPVYRRVTELIAQLLLTEPKGAIAVNFPESFIQDVDSFDEFTRQVLGGFRKSQGSLCVEVSHAVLQKHFDRLAQLAKLVRQSGFQFGIDHVDPDASVNTLREINPDYVKINARFLGDVNQTAGLNGFHALRSVTRTLDIALIVVGVEDEALRQRLLELDVDGMQGNLLHKPEKVV